MCPACSACLRPQAWAFQGLKLHGRGVPKQPAASSHSEYTLGGQHVPPVAERAHWSDRIKHMVSSARHSLFHQWVCGHLILERSSGLPCLHQLSLEGRSESWRILSSVALVFISPMIQEGPLSLNVHWKSQFIGVKEHVSLLITPLLVTATFSPNCVFQLLSSYQLLWHLVCFLSVCISSIPP